MGLFVGAVVLLAMVGCNQKPSLVGNWKGQLTVQGQTVDSTSTITADKITSTFSSMGRSVTLVQSYTATEKEITATIESLDAGADLPAMAKQMLDQAKGQKSTSTYVFKDNDTLEMTGSGTTATWTRVK